MFRRTIDLFTTRSTQVEVVGISAFQRSQRSYRVALKGVVGWYRLKIRSPGGNVRSCSIESVDVDGGTVGTFESGMSGEQFAGYIYFGPETAEVHVQIQLIQIVNADITGSLRPIRFVEYMWQLIRNDLIFRPLIVWECFHNPLDPFLLLFKFPDPRRDAIKSKKLVPTRIFDLSRLDERRETILLISHEGSRTGAPILAWNVAKRLCHRYNVVALLLRGGDIVGNFEDCCSAVIGPLNHDERSPAGAEQLIRRLSTDCSIAYAIVNSVESRLFIPALAKASIPAVFLIHEFASNARPKGALGEGLDWSTQIVFSTEVTAKSALSEYPHLANRTMHVLPQGRCDIPQKSAEVATDHVEVLSKVFRPDGYKDAFVVLGAGFVHFRKGVDLFLSCAAAVSALDPKRTVRFVWIGDGYDLENDPGYSGYLGEQIARSGLETKIAIIEAIENLEAAYAMTDVFFLSSRLDALPNVTIDAAFHGLPVVCFEGASGMATLLAGEASLRPCVVPHLDVHAAAKVIAQLANDEHERARAGSTMRCVAKMTFDMDRYVNRLDELGREAIDMMQQRAQDFVTVRDDPLFDASMFLPPGSMRATRDDAIRQFLAHWAAVGTSRKPTTNFYFRRPCAGFHPQIYAHEHSGIYDTALVNPLAHFIRSGKPEGPWWHEVVTPAGNGSAKPAALRTALHVHFYYPELIDDFLPRLNCNRSRCDLVLTTDTEAKTKELHRATSGYRCGTVMIRIVPNRGRDIGAFLAALADDIVGRYDIVGHLHGKRSVTTPDPKMGDRWREFLWQHLLGDLYPMMDIILHRFSENESLGIVFPEDPHLPDWDSNLEIAMSLATRMHIEERLPPFFNFPIGTMFWARPDALTPLLDLKFDWTDYPEEPLPDDGTILHAIERLLPFGARSAGYQYATTKVPKVKR